LCGGPIYTDFGKTGGKEEEKNGKTEVGIQKPNLFLIGFFLILRYIIDTIFGREYL
jgi:hypothetical protein